MVNTQNEGIGMGDSKNSIDEKGRRDIKTAEIDSTVERCGRDRRRMCTDENSCLKMSEDV